MPARIPQEVDSKIATARQRSKFARFDYTERDANGNLDAVYCRSCGSKIKGWVDSENAPDGKIRQRFQQLGNYVEVVFRLNDGSVMHVAACKDCEAKLRDPAVRDDIMAVELAAWGRSLRASNVPQEYMDRFMDAHTAKTIVQVLE